MRQTDPERGRLDFGPPPGYVERLREQARGFEDKQDQGKTSWRILPWPALSRVARIFHFGAKKYGPTSWRSMADQHERCLDATLRHLVAHMEGEVHDPESGFPHLYHAAASLLISIDAAITQDEYSWAE